MNPIVVIGGGIAGITAAVEAAEVGRDVVLIEKKSYLGGRVVMMNHYFPKLCPPYCGLELNFRRIKNNPRIRVITSAVVSKIEGSPGNYRLNIEHEPGFVNDNCTACGRCEEVCPVERENEFNYNLNQTRAIYLPHELAYPFRYHIDESVCLKEQCGKCLEACNYNAIDFNEKAWHEEINAEAIIIATGWKPYNAGNLELLHYHQSKNIITNVEFERLTAPNGPFGGNIARPGDGRKPKKIAFAQCAGSRDENHLSYCSGVCCSASLKHALVLREIDPEAEIKIFYIDLRVTGRNEDFLLKASSDPKIHFIKGKIAHAEENTENGNIIIEAEDLMAGIKIKEEVDLLVLATGIVPEECRVNHLQKDNYGFYSVKNNSGIIVTGCAAKPMDVAQSVRDATGAALKAIQITSTQKQ